MINTLLAMTAFTICSISYAGDGDSSRETIAVPATYQHNWLEKQPHMLLSSAASIQQKDDGTTTLKNVTLTFAFNGSVLSPTDVVAFADFGSRSILLKAKKDSRAYKALANNMTIKHGGSRQPRFDVVGHMRYCAPIINGQADALNPVAVLDVKTVRFYLVPAGTP